MTAFVDTNVVVRHLTGDPPHLAARAITYLRSGETLLLTDLIVAEVVYVLEFFYEVARSDIARSLRSLIAFDPVISVDPSLILRAVELFEVDSMDFADAYLVACAESTGVGRVASFDRGIDRIKTVTRVAP